MHFCNHEYDILLTNSISIFLGVYKWESNLKLNQLYYYWAYSSGWIPDYQHEIIIYSCNMTLNFAIKYFLLFDNTYWQSYRPYILDLFELKDDRLKELLWSWFWGCLHDQHQPRYQEESIFCNNMRYMSLFIAYIIA